MIVSTKKTREAKVSRFLFYIKKGTTDKSAHGADAERGEEDEKLKRREDGKKQKEKK